jgi:RND family efflux transporter MFP subunit
MDPSVVTDDPKMKCPICGMPLSKRKKGEKVEPPPGVLARLQFPPYRIRQAGIITAPVEYRRLVREVRTVGTVDYDERKLARITARVAGRIDRLFVDFTGAAIRKGQPLVWLYSPDLVITQENYLDALKTLAEIESREQHDEGAARRARAVVESTRKRLLLWGVAEEQIAALEKAGKAETHLEILSPIDGTVIRPPARTGEYVGEGTELYFIADLGRLWLQVEVFERDIGLVREGQTIEVASEAYPGESFAGTVAFIHPTVEPETRTVKVRVEVENPAGKLKPGMYVTAILRLPVGRQAEVFYGCCENCPEIRSDAPGECPKCRMMLVKRGIAGSEGSARPAAGAEETYFVCEMHPEKVFREAGRCFEEGCNGMKLRELKVPPGSRLVFSCPKHHEVQRGEPGTCPVEGCGEKLQFRVISEASRLAESWACPMHPERTGGGRAPCPDCGRPKKEFQYEEVLAVPFSAVIDTGHRKVVFLEKESGIFDAVEVKLGPRAGEYHQVLDGLALGDRVVTAGAFLLDAATRLNPAAAGAYFGASGHDHGGQK